MATFTSLNYTKLEALNALNPEPHKPETHKPETPEPWIS